jgi:hypothetical protein
VRESDITQLVIGDLMKTLILFILVFSATAFAQPDPTPTPNACDLGQPLPPVDLGDIDFGSSTSNGGIWSGGGGDPIPVEVKPFPNQIILAQAIALIEHKVKESPFIDEFKKAFLEDLKILKDKNRFYYIPSLFAVGFSRYPGDYQRLVSNGAMTEFRKGSPIYFSKQAEKYDIDSLARVIAQEIPHHIFKTKLGRNEEFVNNLGTFLIVGGGADAIPTRPYHHGRLIWEEFGNRVGRETTQWIVDKYTKKLNERTWSNLFVLGDLAWDLYRNRGSQSWHNTSGDSYTDISSVYNKFKTVVDITKSKTLIREMIGRCLFTTYEDGESEFNRKEQELTVKIFMDMVAKAKYLKSFHYIEGKESGAFKQFSNCSIAIEDLDGRVLTYYSINDENLPHQPAPPTIPTPIQ